MNVKFSVIVVVKFITRKTYLKVIRLFQNIFSGNSPGTISGINRRKDGTTYPVEIRIGVVDSGGEKWLLALARDVSERVGPV